MTSLQQRAKQKLQLLEGFVSSKDVYSSGQETRPTKNGVPSIAKRLRLTLNQE
jgi:hypothetical protein